MKKPLYRLQERRLGLAWVGGMVIRRGDVEIASSEKVIPPVVSYNNKGEIKVIVPKEILSGLKIHPYKALSKDFNEARLADHTVAAFYSHLEHWPTIPLLNLKDKRIPHPMAEFLYSNMIYLKPDASVLELQKRGFQQYSRLLPQILEKVSANVLKTYGRQIDLHAVPKRHVGMFAYLGEADGISTVAKALSFGLHHLFPTDRIVREASSFKAAEPFLNPVHGDFPILPAIQPFVTTLRIAVIGTKHSMLDSGDLYPSGVPKIACELRSIKLNGDIPSIPKDEFKMALRPFHGGIEVYHQEETVVNELEEKPGGLRLVLPGGVKFACQLQADQAVDQNGQPIDLILDFRTLASKGAAALFCFDESKTGPIPNNLNELRAMFNELPRREVWVGSTVYEGYILNVPVIRPGQRYTELSKPSDRVSIDFISKATLKKEFRVPQFIEREYQDLKTLYYAINNQILNLENQVEGDVLENHYAGTR